MKRLPLNVLVLAVLCCVATQAFGEELIVEFTGTESTTTRDFVVKGPWITDWRVVGDYPGQMALNVNLLGAPTGTYEGKIVTTKYVSDGVKLFDEGGTFRFQVNSTLVRGWTLRVVQLTEEEAKAYKPKEHL